MHLHEGCGQMSRLGPLSSLAQALVPESIEVCPGTRVPPYQGSKCSLQALPVGGEVCAIVPSLKQAQASGTRVLDEGCLPWTGPFSISSFIISLSWRAGDGQTASVRGETTGFHNPPALVPSPKC